MVYGRVDVLLNTAGTRGTGRDVVSNLQRALSANVVGAVAVAEYYKHLLRRSASPRIVFVSPSSHGGDVDARTGAQPPTATLSEHGISRAALKIAIAQIARTYTSERGLEHLKVLGADTSSPATERTWEASRADSSLAAPRAFSSASLVANVAKGQHDDMIGMVVSGDGVSE